MKPLQWTAATSAADVTIKKKFFEPGMNTLIISNKEMKDTMQIVKSLEDSGLIDKRCHWNDWKGNERTKLWIISYVVSYILLLGYYKMSHEVKGLSGLAKEQWEQDRIFNAGIFNIKMNQNITMFIQ